MTYTMLNSYMRETIIKGQSVIIGKDYGTMGDRPYYFVELNGEVLTQGHIEHLVKAL